MSYTRGESQALGIGVEASRGVAVAPQDFVRLREPADVNTELEKTEIQETKLSGVSSQESVITKKMVAGTLTPNLRFETLGYFLKSLLGGVATASEDSVFRHTFTLDANVLQPSLTLALARGGFPHKQVNGAVVNQLGLTFPLDDVINGTVGLMGRSETTVADYTPAFASTDHLAPHQMATIKLATNVAGLSGASGICVTGAEVEMNRNSRDKLCLSSVEPVDFFAKLLEISGKFTWEKNDDTYKDLAEANTPQAMQIDVVNTNVAIGGASNPTLSIVFPKVTLSIQESRPLDDIITEDVNFMVHYDDAEAQAVTIDLLNEQTDYDA